jgi:hypothetical protein
MKRLLLILAAIVVTPQGWAEDRFVDAQPGAKHIAAPLPKSSAASPEANADAIAVPKNQNVEARYQCYTNTQGCSGVAYFRNGNAKGVGCTIWKNNGAAGRVNFTLGPGESTAYNVIYNDTYNCVWIEYAPPEPNLRREYIGVS